MSKENPMERDIAEDSQRLFTDIEQLRYMAHDFVTLFTELVDGPVGDVIPHLAPELGLELSLKALVLHEGTCTHKKAAAVEGSAWKQSAHQVRNVAPKLN